MKAEDSSPIRSSPADDADVVGAVDWLVLAKDTVLGEEETGVCYKIKLYISKTQ